MKIHQYEPFYSLRTRSETETPTTSKKSGKIVIARYGKIFRGDKVCIHSYE
jgi:hypothetical protein